MTQRTVRHHARQHASSSLPPDYFNAGLLNEAQAGYLFRECMREIDQKVTQQRATSQTVKVGDERAQLHVLINRNGHLERFWLRLAVTNELLIVGARRGLLPLNSGALL